MRIKIVVEINKVERKRLAQFLGRDKLANRETCKNAFIGAIEAEKDSWFVDDEGEPT